MARDRFAPSAHAHRVWMIGGILLLATIGIGPVAQAQGRDAGQLAVVLRGPDGGPAPGVFVTLSGPQNEHVATSDASGIVLFRGLVPGTYAVRTTAPELRGTLREALVVSTGATTRIRLDLELEGIEEVLLVEGASPLIDPLALQIGATVDSNLVDLTPSGAGLFNGVLDKVPGVILSGVDVGGGNATQQQAFTAHGSLAGQNQLFLNGSPTHDTNGAAGMFYAVPAFAEVRVSTAAHDIEHQAPGVVVNMVSKSGSNSLRGGIRYYYSDESLAGNNITDELLEEGLEKGNPNTLLSDFDVQLGGPLIRNRLWAFVDYNRFDERRLIIGLPEGEQDERNLRNVTANLDWQVATDHRLSLRYFFSSKFRVNQGANPSKPPPSAGLQDPSDAHVVQANWLATWSERTFSDLRVSYRDAVLGFVDRSPDSAAPHPDYPVGVPSTYDWLTDQYSGAPGDELNWTRDYSAMANVSHIIDGGSLWHDLKFGAHWREVDGWGIWTPTHGTIQFLADGEPDSVWLESTPGAELGELSRDDTGGTRTRELSAYLQDSAQLGTRWSISGGLRFDYSRVWIPAHSRPDSWWAGLIPDDEFGANFRARSFPQVDVVDWSSLSPRLSVAHDLSGRGTTFLKAGYAQYTLQANSKIAGKVNPGSGTNEYLWTDTNGDGIFQWDERGDLYAAYHPGLNTGIDPDLKPATTHEFTARLEHQTHRDIVLGVTGIYRTVTNVVEDINIGVPYGPVAERLGVEDSYTPVQTTDPGPDGIIGTGDDGGTITVWSQDPSTLGQNFSLVTNPAAWGLDASYDYRGIEFTAQKRFSNRWQALASWTIGRIDSNLTGSTGVAITTTAVFENPNRDINRAGRSPDDRTHVVKVNGSYLFPDPVGVNLGVSLRHESGRPVRRQFTLPSGVVTPGRPTIVAAPWGEDDNPASLGGRMSAITILDLRAEKQFSLPSRWGRLALSLDAFNLLNENAERAVVDRAGRAYGRIQQIVPPRLIRVGIGWTF